MCWPPSPTGWVPGKLALRFTGANGWFADRRPVEVLGSDREAIAAAASQLAAELL
jgi:hypothetical protein